MQEVRISKHLKSTRARIRFVTHDVKQSVGSAAIVWLIRVLRDECIITVGNGNSWICQYADGRTHLSRCVEYFCTGILCLVYTYLLAEISRDSGCELG